MKKSLLAVAVASALPAFAYAQTNVTLYGIVDARLEWSNDAANGAANDSNLRVDDNIGSGSRFGLRGTEDLGGGLKAIFQIEHRFSPDTGETRGGPGINTNPPGTGGNPTGAGNQKFWNGQSWVGLEGSWGSVRLGRQYTPIFWAMIGSDVTGYNHYNNVAGAGGTAVRFDNAIEYRTPVWGGLQAYLTFSPDEVAGVDGDIWGAALIWNSGPINVGLGYHNIDSPAGGFDQYSISGSYNFGAFKVGAGYAESETAAGDRDDTWLSVGVKLGPGDLWFNFRRVDAPVAAGDANLIGLTYNYPLSRRTSLYASMRNDDPRASGLDTQRAFAVGIRHLF